MVRDRDTEIGGQHGNFPTTHWSHLEAVRGPMGPAHREALNLLIVRYWRPVYCYIRRRGRSSEDAKDLCQEFFTSWLQRELFGRADPTRGRFRCFLLSCLDRFLASAYRAAHAKHRCPEGGIVSIHELVSDEDAAFEPAENDTPETIFDRAWIREVLMRVSSALEEECQATGKNEHYELFRRRIIEPALEGASLPPLRNLARELGLTQREAGNRLTTARRAYQRLLREEIRIYAASEDDVASEIRDFFDFVAKP